MKKRVYTLQEYAKLYLTMLYEQDWIEYDGNIFFVPFSILLCDYKIDGTKVIIDMCLSYSYKGKIIHFDVYQMPFPIRLFSEPSLFERYLSNIFINKRLYLLPENLQYCKNIIIKDIA